MSTSSIAITGMRVANEVISKTSHNIANTETPGFKSAFVELSNISNNNGVQSIAGDNIDIKGGFENTGIVTDLATNGNGFFIVKDKLSGDVLNVATGSFRPNVDGELEYLGKFLLLAIPYKNDGSLPPFDLESLEPVKIDINQMSKAVASTNVTESFNLNSGLLAKGQASFVMTPSAAAASSTKKIDDPLVPSGNLKNGNGFSIEIQSEKNGQPSSETLRCIFNAVITKTFSSKGTEISTAIYSSGTNSVINYTFGSVSVPLDLKTIVKPGDTNDAALNSISTHINGTKVNSVGGNTTISIKPLSNTSLQITGDLTTTIFGQDINILPAVQGTIRFASMEDLKEQLHKNFKEIKVNSNSQSLLFIAKPDTNISMSNLQVDDVLDDLGMYPGPVLGQGYDPYDTNSNMASGNAIPDIRREVALYDSKGGQHIFNIALKKVEDGWMQEFYASDNDEIQGIRDDGLLQVTKFKFDTKGNLSSAEIVAPSAISSAVNNPFDPIPPSPSGNTVVINGVTLTQGTDFKSMIDLVNSINSNITLKSSVEATIVEDSHGQFRLNLISKNGLVPIVVSAVLSFGSTPQQLPSALEKLTITFNTSANIDPINVNFDYKNINEAVYKDINGFVDVNGVGVSRLSSISIDSDGILAKTFENGYSVYGYKIPLGIFHNMRGLDVLGNNALRQTKQSGKMEMVSAGASSSGEILSGNLEQSNVDTAEQLTQLVVYKQLYNMNTKSWQTGNAIVDYILSSMN
jgi:flagellar hook-basal body protein